MVYAAASGPSAQTPLPAALRERRYPLALAFCCCSFLLGVYNAAVPLALPLLLLAATLPLILSWRKPGLSSVLLAVSCLLALWLGTWRGLSTAYHDGPGQIAHYAGALVTVVGVIDGEALTAGSGENLPLQVESLQRGSRLQRVTGRILVHYSGSAVVEYGDRLQLKGRLDLPYQVPGFDYRAYLAQQNIHATLNFPTVQILAHGAGNPIEALALGLRGRLRAETAVFLPHAEAALLSGILLGAPTHSLGAATEAFVTAGMIHIVAISGLKVALVAGMLIQLARPLPKRRRWIPAALGVAAYVVLSGATPSGLRSALMWLLAALAARSGRRSDVWVSLTVVAAGMVCWKPLLLWDTGFQLSLTGTAGIALWTDWFARALRRLPFVLRESIAVTLAAQLATLPITAMGFGQVSLIGPLANGLLLPVLGPIMALGGAATVLGLLAPFLRPLLEVVLYPWLHGFILVVEVLAASPIAAVRWPMVPPVLLLSYYGVLAIAARLSGARLPLRSRGHGGPFAVLAVLPLWPLLALLISVPLATRFVSRPPAEAQLWLAGSGHSQALLLTSGDQGLLLDGGDARADLQSLLGTHLPFWQRSLRMVLVSEPDRTHLAGLQGLSDLYQLGSAVDPGAIYPSVAYASWRAALRGAGVRERKARSGQRFMLGAAASVQVLLPETVGLDQVPAAVAYLVQAGRVRVLVPNREAVASGAALLRFAGCLDVLVVPNRADPAATAALIRALHPHLVALPPPTSSGIPLLAAPAGVALWRSAPQRAVLLSQRNSCASSTR